MRVRDFRDRLETLPHGASVMIAPGTTVGSVGDLVDLIAMWQGDEQDDELAVNLAVDAVDVSNGSVSLRLRDPDWQRIHKQLD